MGTDQYSVWTTDDTGNMLANPSGVVSGSSSVVQFYEPSFQQGLNGDGRIGLPTTIIESFGSTELAQLANNYFLFPTGGSTGPQIKYNHAPVTVGQFGSFVPIGEEQIAGGYEIAWKMGADQYSVWTTDSGGNMLANPSGVVSGSSSVLQSYEPSFH